MSNIENLRDIIENYSEELKHLPSSEIENLQALLEDIKDKPKSIWDLDIAGGKEYYVLWTDGHIDANDFISHLDEKKRDMGNAFLTREEAEFERERRKVEAIMKKYSRPFEHDEDNWYIEYSHYSKHIGIDALYEYDCGIIYFESEEIARDVINKIGEDRLKKYWFRVNS
nr:MAG TPA: hypothetical protein [Caudoviricetes sp.]